MKGNERVFAYTTEITKFAGLRAEVDGLKRKLNQLQECASKSIRPHLNVSRDDKLKESRIA